MKINTIEIQVTARLRTINELHDAVNKQNNPLTIPEAMVILKSEFMEYTGE